MMTLLLHAWAVRDSFATEGVHTLSLDSEQDNLKVHHNDGVPGGAGDYLMLGSGGSSPTVEVYVALYDHGGNEAEGELAFKKGDLIYIQTNQAQNMWRHGYKGDGSKGLVPMNYVKKKETPTAETGSNDYSSDYSSDYMNPGDQLETWPSPGQVVRIKDWEEYEGKQCVVMWINPEESTGCPFAVKFLSEKAGKQVPLKRLTWEEPELVKGQTRQIHDAPNVALNGMGCVLQEFSAQNYGTWTVLLSDGRTVSLPVESLVSQSPQQVFAVAYAYAAQEEGEITLNKGDHVNIIGGDRDWVTVEDIKSGMQGMYPRNHLEDQPLLGLGFDVEPPTGRLYEGTDSYYNPGLYAGETVWAWSQSKAEWLPAQIVITDEADAKEVAFDYLKGEHGDGSRRYIELGPTIIYKIRKVEDLYIQYSFQQKVWAKIGKSSAATSWHRAYVDEQPQKGQLQYLVTFTDGPEMGKRRRQHVLSIMPAWEELWNRVQSIRFPGHLVGAWKSSGFMLVEKDLSTSTTDVVEKLNKRQLQCEQGFLAMYSHGWKGYVVLYEKPKKEAAERAIEGVQR
jgi:hypothetical protein